MCCVNICVYCSVCVCVLCVCCIVLLAKSVHQDIALMVGMVGPLEGSASSSGVSENRRHTTLNTRKKSGHAWSIHHGEPSTKVAPNVPIQKGSDSQQLQHARLHPVFPQEPHVSSTSLHHVAMRMDRKLPKHLWNHGSIESMQDPLGNTAVQSTALGRWRLQQPAQRSFVDKSQSQDSRVSKASRPWVSSLPCKGSEDVWSSSKVTFWWPFYEVWTRPGHINNISQYHILI